ncbi:MAG: sugar isomerase [Candidatus Sumerlaeia bacterium]|nr:sugar isomerase [Candidatus Sumerlaeia bacterium]
MAGDIRFENAPISGCCGHSVPRIPGLQWSGEGGVSRRSFFMGLGTTAIGAWALRPGSGRGTELSSGHVLLPKKQLVVKPVLTYDISKRRPQTSWRNWGGIMTKEDVDKEVRVLTDQLAAMQKKAEFNPKILPVSTVANKTEAAAVRAESYDVLLLCASGAGVDTLEALCDPARPTIMFVRHLSGPVYLWYEIAHPRFLRKTVDEYGQPGMDPHDVVVDSFDAVLWRLRALHGLKNAMGQKIVCIGDAGGWAAGGKKAPQLTREKWHMELIPVGYPELGERIKAARADSKRTALAEAQAKAFLADRGVKLETERKYVVNAFLLTNVFKDLMAQHQTNAITVHHCMGTIMPISETTACLPLMLLNDEGYMAFCESDFVVIPSGVLLHHISGLPVFLNDPTYPHDGIVTVAHCTGPRKLDGRRFDRVRVMTHFESDYGAAPKVDMEVGERITMIDPDFNFKRWLGFTGKTLKTPFMHICRDQVDVTIEGDMKKLLENMVGFHWMMCYGDYRKEVGYALKKAGIEWVDVSEKA